MGGLNSGRTPGYRPTLDTLRRIDVQHLRRQGCLQPEYAGSLRWSRNDRPIASISIQVTADAITLDYRSCKLGEEASEDVTQVVPLARLAQHLGGERIWLICPGCLQRCGALYGGERFYCRRCVNLPYASQRQPLHERLLDRAQATRVRLGGTGSMEAPFPAKPKGMRQSTYQQIHTQDRALNHRSLMAAAKAFKLPGFG